MRLSAIAVGGVAAAVVAVASRVPARNAAHNTGYRLSTMGGNPRVVGRMAIASSGTEFSCNTAFRTAPKGSDERTTSHDADYTTEIFEQRGKIMIIFGAVLMLIGFILGVPILWSIGVIVLIVGVVLWLLGAMGHMVGGRRHYY